MLDSIACTTREQYISIIRQKMIEGIYNDGRGFSRDLDEVTSVVYGFVQHVMANKSFEQLALIEALPTLHVSPALLKRCGLVDNTVPKSAQAVIYWKFVQGNGSTLENVKRWSRPSTIRFATRAEAFMRIETVPPHIQMAFTGDPVVLDKPITAPIISHVGRYVNGATSRRYSEVSDVRKAQKNPDAGERPWVAALLESSNPDFQAANIQYLPLVCHDDKIGTAWTHYVVSLSL
jgi:hypothetical protein